MTRAGSRLLLHVCCGPCAIHPVGELPADYELVAYYYNPNIHPKREYARRLAVAKRHFAEAGIRFATGPYDPEVYFEAVASDQTKPARCGKCYLLRLGTTARAAASLDCGVFTSTLLVSPYQDRDAILAAGREAATAAGVRFLEEDFRDGYRDAANESRRLGMYRQKYCGCTFSQAETSAERRRSQK